MPDPLTAPAGDPGSFGGLLGSYVPQPGVADELFDATGAIRPVWRPFLEHLGRIDAEGVAMRFDRGTQYLRDAGVYYRKYGAEAASERDWPLSPIPVLLSQEEWTEIAAGLIARADLLEQVVADLYGENRLLAEGHLPAELIAQNPAWLRPMVGVKPASGHFLNFIAFEVGRAPSGQWWVLGDRTDAPSGAGFALENRIATSRTFPNFYARANVHRLAGFFQAFRDTLVGQRQDRDEPLALLTPGQMNDVYFEHAYLARYLGMLLVEGEDLTVDQGQLKVRSVNGLRPISVLWRRLDAEFCDPLELNEASTLGTAGFVDVVRRGGVSCVNALGAGVLETRAMLAFLPKISRALTGAPLALPNIATWWCGQAAERAHVLAHRDKMMISSAYATRLPYDDPGGTSGPEDYSAEGSARVAKLLEDRGGDLVGQEIVTLSTTPVWKDGKLAPRPMSLRIFLARTATGWRVMPGGYARVASRNNASAIAMQAGGSVSDVWVVSDSPVPRPSLMPAPSGDPGGLNSAYSLPSRAADNLFWLGRYIERAEGAMRAYRAYYGLISAGVEPDADLPDFILRAFLNSTGRDPVALSEGFQSALEAAVDCAARIRDQVSVDGMLALKDLLKASRKLRANPIAVEEAAAAVGILLRKLTGFSGLVHENMYRSAGWRFMSAGMSVERASTMCAILARVLDPDAPDGALDLALELGDSTMAHRARFLRSVSPDSLRQILALDPDNPRAVGYHLGRLKSHIDALPQTRRSPGLSPVARAALQVHTDLAVQVPDTLTPDRLRILQRQIWTLSDLLAATYLT
ncbi:circularly permuted type 2 ATP-grasp protein [Dinoroseobacter sp. PD6]|uniref:circularly permuted type 2 ATP-grasp protein n=1 Tax=Dinoroseobacter sp. PD6 TaxID=3028384 RepID=UPI00237B523F|nr:circularly permuted type 2 ATP-grasp protein [Dinoroseobacter sp. PD6]MDD9718439.1 circularly permuted type 2 ATP-grasp protein [Dinoroseobacter sp. PD6]